MPDREDGPGEGVHQEIGADRDAYVAGGNQYVFNFGGAASPDPGGRAAMGRLPDMLPAPYPPNEFVARPDVFPAVLGRLLDAPPMRGRVIAITGMSGAGKSVLAQALAWNGEVRERFGGGVLWLHMERDSPLGFWRDRILEVLDGEVPQDPVDASALLQSRFSGKRCLIVLDNATTAEQVQSVNVLGPDSALLVTTHNEELLEGVEGFPVGPCLEDTSLELLEKYVGPELVVSPEVRRVLEHCGGLPVALAICGAMARGRRHEWAEIADLLDRAAFDRLRMPLAGGESRHLRTILEVGVGSLPAGDQDLYKMLAVFADRGPVPVSAAGMLWELNTRVAREKIADFAGRSLLTYQRAGGVFWLHDLMAWYLASLADDGLASLHQQLFGTYLDAWGGIAEGLPEAAPGDGYGISNLAHHLDGAGQAVLLHRVLAAERPGLSGAMENTWFAVHYEAGPGTGYLNDLDLARRLAEQATDQSETAAERARNRALEMQYALARSPATGIASRIPPPLLAVLVRDGIWPLADARVYAEGLPALPARAAALAALARLPGIGCGLLADAREAAGKLTDAGSRAWALARLIPCEAEQDRDALFDAVMQAVTDITDGHRQAEARAWILIRLAPHVPRRVRQHYADIESEVHWLGGLLLAAPHIPELGQQLSAAAHRLGRQDRQPADILRVIPFAPPQDKALLVADAHHALLEMLNPPVRRKPRKRRKWRREKKEHTNALLSAESGIALLKETVLGMREDSEAQAELLVALLPLVDGPQQEVVAAAGKAIRQAGRRIDHHQLGWLIRGLPEADRGPVVDDLIRPDPGLWPMCAVARYLPPDLRRLAVDQACALTDDFRRNQAFESLAPWLSPELARRALRAFSQFSLDAPEDRGDALARLASRIPQAGQADVVAAIATVQDADLRTSLLATVAAHTPAALTSQLLAALPPEANPDYRAVVLMMLAGANEGAERAALHEEAVDAACTSTSRELGLRELPRLATSPNQLANVLTLRNLLERTLGKATVSDPSHLAERLPPGALDETVSIAREMDDECHRAHALAGLAACTSGVLQADLLKEALDAACAPHQHRYSRTSCGTYSSLAEAVRHVPEHQRHELPASYLDQVQPTATPRTRRGRRATEDHRNPPDEDQRIRQLTCILMYLPEGSRKETAALAASELRHPWAERPQVSSLIALAPFLAADHAEEVAALIDALPEDADKVGPLAVLAHHTAEPARKPLLERAIDAARSDAGPSASLGKLIPLLEEPQRTALLRETLNRLHAVGDGEAVAREIATLAPLLPAQLLAEAAGTAGKITDPKARADARRALASAGDTADPAHWQLWRAALADAAASDRAAVLSAAVDACLHVGGDVTDGETEPTAAHLADAILTAFRWWPGRSQARKTGWEVAVDKMVSIADSFKDDSDYEIWMSDWPPDNL